MSKTQTARTFAALQTAELERIASREIFYGRVSLAMWALIERGADWTYNVRAYCDEMAAELSAEGARITETVTEYGAFARIAA